VPDRDGDRAVPVPHDVVLAWKLARQRALVGRRTWSRRSSPWLGADTARDACRYRGIAAELWTILREQGSAEPTA